MSQYKVCIFYNDGEVIKSPSMNVTKAARLFDLLQDLTSNNYTQALLDNIIIILANPDQVKTITIEKEI